MPFIFQVDQCKQAFRRGYTPFQAISTDLAIVSLNVLNNLNDNLARKKTKPCYCLHNIIIAMLLLGKQWLTLRQAVSYVMQHSTESFEQS